MMLLLDYLLYYRCKNNFSVPLLFVLCTYTFILLVSFAFHFIFTIYRWFVSSIFIPIKTNLHTKMSKNEKNINHNNKMQ